MIAQLFSDTRQKTHDSGRSVHSISQTNGEQMPVAKSKKFDARSALIIGGSAVLAALLISAVALVSGQRTSRLVLGDIDFRTLKTNSMAAEIEENGPILFPDIASGTREIWLQHLGDDPAVGWHAFDARVPGTGQECNVRWMAETREFLDPCTDTTYLQDGTGLPKINVYLDGKDLIIDLNNVRQPSEFEGYRP